jgi:hypothetical protein
MTTNRSKECEDNILKPLKIRIIQATPFILLARKRDYKIFAVIIEDIKTALELKQYVNPWPLMPKEYHDLINEFKKRFAD